MLNNILFLAVIPFFLLAEEPWGQDACIAYGPQKTWIQTEPSSKSLLARAGTACIRFHKNVISPADGPRSHFKPNSSQYTLDAMENYGFFVGVTYGCDRLMRENNDPWIYKKVPGVYMPMKWNPVP